MLVMAASAIGMAVSLLVNVAALSTVFTTTYVVGFGVSLGPLIWVVSTDLFPDSVHAMAMSLCICCNWMSNLIVGVSYPYIAAALGDLGFVPFVVTLFVFYYLTFKTVPETQEHE
ncbi:hypothetical protein BBJ28_00017367 [Nothophytophthora sp. Chile5]|nr:hypothetical protein BBJ28_00017367 [Nothophytophthora sp. Chile5]